ncbi:hypothetical protein JXQ70_18715 [bacterium]|nr:hypothetical protein [bacterium]
MNEDKDTILEHITIETVSTYHDYALVSITDVPVGQDSLVTVLSRLAERGINVNQMAQITDQQGLAQLQFTVHAADAPRVCQELEQISEQHPNLGYSLLEPISRIVLSGSGIRTYSELVVRVLEALEQQKITAHLISTSEMSLSLYVDYDQANQTSMLLEALFLKQH